jgi:two-component system, cell cycle response regulator
VVVSQDKSCFVGALGLQEHEVRLVKSILRHSNDREQVHYEWTDDLGEAHLVIVSADSEAAMQEWQALAKNHPATVLLLITSKAQESATEYYFSRPFSPSKLLMLLDRIFKEKLASVLETKIFSGEDQAAQHATLRRVNGVATAAHRALVVDDSPTVRKQLELELGSLSIQVDSAETGEQCLDMLEDGRYDIIFLDVVMPGADGYEVCKKIRNNRVAKRTPVIMLTSKSSSFDRVRGALAGCSAYLTKPVDYEKFHKVLAEYLLQGEDEIPVQK